MRRLSRPGLPLTLMAMDNGLSTASELLRDTATRPAADGTLLYARIEGEINLQNSPALRADLLKLVEEQRPRRIVLNLAQVPYMDSSAIAVMIEVLKAIRPGGGTVHLTQLQQRVAGLLRIARLETIFVLNDSDEEAMREAQGPAQGT